LSACSPTSFNLLLLTTHLISLSRPVIFFPSYHCLISSRLCWFLHPFLWIFQVGGYPADSYVF
ncbi:hypothetical protein KSS87_004679, partial [Heliosperma pusillum]